MSRANSPHDDWKSQLATNPLPQLARTKNGVEFNPNLDFWRFRTGGQNVSCNFGTLPPVTAHLRHGFKQAMLGVAETKSASTIRNRFSDFAAMLRYFANQGLNNIDCLGFEELAQYSRSSQSASNRLSSSKSFLKGWAKLGYHGLDQDLARVFPPCQQSRKGEAVATRDPRKGPFDDQEYETLLEAVNAAMEHGAIDVDRGLEARITAMLGVRPAQLTYLKVCDVRKDRLGKITLDMPLAKGVNKATRDEFRNVPLEPTTGEVLWDYRAEIRTAFASLLSDPEQAPLFPQLSRAENTEFEPGLAYHATPQTMGSRITNTLATAFKHFRAASVRLGGKTIPVSPVRLRRSFAQRGADEGIDIWTLAHLMGHRNISSVKVYFEVTDRIRARFSRKLALQMAPLAQTFGAQLRILKNLSEATRPFSESRIPDLRLDEHGHLKWLASCASCSNCSLLRPYACLAGCYSFEPFLDADLEPILDRLITEREDSIDTDERIAKIRDRAIYGCAQIILRQRELLAEGSA